MSPDRPDLRLTPGDVGERVVVRRSLAGGRAAPFGDVVGVLEDWREGVLRVRTRARGLVLVTESEVVAAKVVPPAPRRHQRADPLA